MISFGTKYWIVFLLVILIAAFGVVILLYFKNKENRELTKPQQWILMVLRFLSFFLVAFLLLSPFLNRLKKISKNPVIITAWDNSSSVLDLKDSATSAQVIKDLRNNIIDKIGNKFTLLEYSFGEKAKNIDELNFNEKKSDYSELFSSIINNHFNENIGALIVVGDGIYNQGKNPLNVLNEINFPVYSIGLGDTTELVDSRIENIRVNRTAFSGNQFPVEIDINCSKLKGKPLRLRVIQEGKELANTIITPTTDNYFTSREFIFDAGKAGLKHFTATIGSVDNERNTRNNRSGFVINVLENKQNILILSDGPHPDIGAIKNTLESQKTYDVSVFTEEPYPSNLTDFNLIIINQLPTAGKSIAEIISTSESRRIPILFIVGNKTFLPQLNALAQGIKITPLAGSGEEALATLNPTYGTFKLSEEFKEGLVKFPPLVVPFAEYVLEPEFSPMFYQKIKNIETAKPLIATGIKKGRKIGFVSGEGLWKWRLFNYYTNQNHILFNELVNKIIQYLALRENEDNFIIDYKPVYAEIDDIVLQAEVYNDAYEVVTSEEVNIKISNSGGEEFDFTFDNQGKSYYLNAGKLPTGDYSFISEVTLGSETFNERGNFTIIPVNLEDINTRANHRMLYQLAQESGGKFYQPNESGQLVNDIEVNNSLKPIIYFQEMITELLNQAWLLIVLILIMSVEWFLRKYWGIY